MSGTEFLHVLMQRQEPLGARDQMGMDIQKFLCDLLPDFFNLLTSEQFQEQ